MRRSSMCFSLLLALTLIAHQAVAQTKATTKTTTTSSSAAARRLKLPVEIQGGCMLACCKYGPWQATGRAVAYTARKVSSSIAFTIQPGETVTGLNGTLYTTKPGIVVMDQAVTVKPFKNARQATVNLLAHDTVYVVEVGGETTDAYWWYRGVTYHGTDFSVSGVHGASSGAAYDVLSVPTQEWWARVRNSTGATGWVLDPRSFNGIAGC